MKQKAHQAKQLRAKASELLKRVVLVLAGIFYCTYAHAETWVNLTGAQSLEEGKAAWAKRDYVTAIKNFEPLARKGDPSVQSMVGYMFDEGLGVKQDPKKAFYWYEKAAAQEMLLKWENGDAETIALWKTMNTWVYAGFDITYKSLGVDFDKFYYESDTYLLG